MFTDRGQSVRARAPPAYYEMVIDIFVRSIKNDIQKSGFIYEN
jgi:hypothetical protein